jgi:hypothetical protein
MDHLLQETSMAIEQVPEVVQRRHSPRLLEKLMKEYAERDPMVSRIELLEFVVEMHYASFCRFADDIEVRLETLQDRLEELACWVDRLEATK